MYLKKGTSIMDVIVGTALLLVVFLGIFGVFQLATKIVSGGKAKVGAVALANEQMEFLRSLPYDDVAVAGGIPAGTIPAIENIPLNNVDYIRRTFIQYVDDPSDGLDIDDENGITADYKVAKVEVSWFVNDDEKKVSLVSNIVPKGVETLEGGGVLTIIVINAIGAPVFGAEVNIQNSTTSPAIDIDTFTNTAGRASFPGAPASGGYEITITKPGYSIAQTYDTTVGNPNPNPGHLTVIEGETTSLTFAIDLISDLTIRTFSSIEDFFWEDDFSDSLNVSTLVNTEILGGEAVLDEDPSLGYPASGEVHSTSTSPAYIHKWISFSWSDNTPVDTDILYRIYYESSPGIFSPVPDIDLPNNSIGFSSSPVDLSTLDDTFPSLQTVGFLTTSDASSTPAILDWRVDYSEGPIPLPNTDFNLRGEKEIGQDGGGSPVYKYDEDLQTGSTGFLTINSLEWDSYTVSFNNISLNRDISESCNLQPISVNPSSNVFNNFILFNPHTLHTLLVAVTDDLGTLLDDATVRLYRGAYDETQITEECGQTFFSGLSLGTVAGGNPYSIDAGSIGLASTTISDVDISGQSNITIILNP